MDFRTQKLLDGTLPAELISTGRTDEVMRLVCNCAMQLISDRRAGRDPRSGPPRSAKRSCDRKIRRRSLLGNPRQRGSLGLFGEWWTMAAAGTRECGPPRIDNSSRSTLDQGVEQRPGAATETLAQLPEGHMADGMKFDAAGRLWIATVTGGGFDALDLEKRTLHHVPCAHVPLNCVFVGRHAGRHRSRPRRGCNGRRARWPAHSVRRRCRRTETVSGTPVVR